MGGWLQWIVAVLATLACGGAAAQEQAPEPDRANVLLILADDQGWTGTSVAMDPGRADSASDFYRTPALERLASEGVRFSSAYAPAPNCSPSRASILTGQTPARLHMTDIIGVRPGSPRYEQFYEGMPLMPPLPRSDLPEEAVTIGEWLNEHAPEYVTAHFGKWHLGGGGAGRHGFEVHDRARPWEGRGLDEDNPKDIFGLTDKAIGFLRERADDGRPFYLQVSHFAVHLPVRARPETVEACSEREAGERHGHAEHAAMTEDLDAGVGMLLEALDELGLAESTYVVYFSDNGAYTHNGMTDNLPLREGKASVWEGGIRVPLLVRGPGVAPGSHRRTPVVGWDLFATIAEIAGVEAAPPAEVEGGSILPLLGEGGEEAAVERDSEAMLWHFPHYQTGKGTTPQAAVRVGDLKLIRFFETGEERLFDLASDPGERQDLSDDRPDAAERMSRRLDRALREAGAALPEPAEEGGEG